MAENRSAGSTYYEKNKERLKEYARNRYHQEGGNEK